MRPKRDRDSVSHYRVSRDRWLVSYADFITLLFAFFATMYALSRVDAQRLATIADAVQDAFDRKATERVPLAPAVRPEHSAAVEEAISEDLAAELASERLQLIVDRRGVTLSIPEAGAFPVGQDELSPTARELIGRVGSTLDRFTNAVRVEGHTDDVPIHNVRFASNWDLSAARAGRVVEFLIQQGLAPERLSATGYAEFHPRVPNISPQHRASNRRIDLVILNAGAAAAEPGSASTPAPGRGPSR